MSSQLSPLLDSLHAHPLAIGLVGCKSARALEVVDALASLPLATVEVFGLSGVTAAGIPASAHVSADSADDADAARAAVGAWQTGAVDFLLKLDVSTKVLMRAVLASGAGGWFTHVALILDEGRGNRFLLADSGLNRQPNAADVVRIVERVAHVARALGTAQPRIGLLSYREDPDPLFPLFGEVLDNHAADLANLSVTLVGPTSFDVAVAEAAAAAKGLAGGGVCDGVGAPDIITANALYKAHMLRPDCVVAGLVAHEMGAAPGGPTRGGGG